MLAHSEEQSVYMYMRTISIPGYRNKTSKHHIYAVYVTESWVEYFEKLLYVLVVRGANNVAKGGGA